MRHPQFKYVDLAIGGATKRNHIVEYDKLDIPPDAIDTYSTMFQFKREYLEHVASTGSVRGAAQFECWSPYLWFDIDSASLQDATMDMQALLLGVRAMGVLDHTVVFFSGSKGYHVGIDAGVFGFEPSCTLPDEMRRTCLQMASLFHIEIDSKIYNHNRLWRIADTVHGKTGLYKTALDPVEAMELSIDGIKKIAAVKKGRSAPKHPVCNNTEAVDSLNRLRCEASKGAVKNTTGWDAPPITGKRSKVMQAGLEYLLTHGVTRGDRDNEALLRASECRKLGFDKSDCAGKLNEWNTHNKPPMDDSDLDRVVSSAYTGAGYDFGTNHDSLRIAREYGKKQMEEIDVDKLLNSDVNADVDDTYVRRPRSVAELLVNGGAPEAPELIGEYFSWRKRITLLVGREKYSGKSTICTFEAIAAMRKGHRVLWVSPDEPRDDILYRLVKAGIGQYAEQCVIASDMDVPTSWPELGRFIVEARPDLIILDSIHSLFPFINNGKVPDSSESAEWQKLVAKLRPLAIALDAAVVWLHHANKATGLSTGSIGIAAAVDAVVTMGTVRKPNRRTLSFLGRRVNSTSNCAIDYMGEEIGYELVKDWNQSAESENDEVSKNERARKWLVEFISTWPTDSFERKEAAQAYKDKFNEDPEAGRAFKLAIKNARNLGYIKKNPTVVVGKSLQYDIINRSACGGNTKATDLLKEDDNAE